MPHKSAPLAARTDESSGSQTVARAAQILKLVCASRNIGLPLSDVVQLSGLPKPTARRLLVSLIDAGLVQQVSESRRYYAGPETYALGLFATERFGILQFAGDRLVQIAARSGDTALLSIPRGLETLCLAREEGSYPLRSHVLQPGHRHPMGCGAPGIALLMHRSDFDIDRTLSANAKVYRADYPGVTAEVIWHQIKQARRSGYALNQGIIFPGSYGMAVAVLDEIGQPCATLGVSGVEQRFAKQRLVELAEILGSERDRLERQIKASRSR